uniref:DNA pilot protein n=1 Tax=Dulem virus 141 TaxID=3145618 RepID=A0AAU8B0X0_9VIRU
MGLGSLAGALGMSSGFDLLGSAASAGLNYLSSSALQRQNQQWQENFYKHRYQWQVEDMKSAGLNPVLSALNASAGSSVPTGGAPAGSHGNALGNTARALAERQFEVADSQIAVASAQQQKFKADAEKSLAEAAKVRKETTQIPGLTQLEVDNEFKKRTASVAANIVRDVYGASLGSYDVAKRSIDRLVDSRAFSDNRELARRFRYIMEREATGAKKLPSEGDLVRIFEQAKREADAEAKRPKSGVRHPTGRSVLY